MIVSYKKRTIDYSKPARIYWNLNSGCWSIRQKSKVVAHSDFLALLDVKPVVSEKGRQRVIRTGRKNVHAYLEGIISLDLILLGDTERQIRYNPYQNISFYFINKNSDVEYMIHAETVLFTSDGKVYGENINATRNN